MANPTLLSRLLCADADKNTIPDTDAGTAGVFSQQYGWQAINSLPLSAGGKAVQRQDFNGVFNLLGGIAFYAQKGWQFEFDEMQNYFAGCVVRDTADGKLYECLNDVSASSTHPNADSTNWKATAIDTSTFANKQLSNLDTSNLTCHLVVDSYYNSSTGDWYRVYDDGWVEQGGKIMTPVDATQYNISFLKPMADINYNCQLSITIPSNDYGCIVNEIQGNRTTTGLVFRCYFFSGSLSANDFATWTVFGMGASV